MDIFIDFDGTLFDTSRFYNDFINLCKSYKVSETNIYNIRNQSNELFNLDNLAFKIKDKYNLDESFIDDVNKLYKKEYLYDDVISFLESNYLKYNLCILSYGEKNYQLKKINCCRFKKYFKKIIITTDKAHENIDYQNSIFIDNNPKEIENLSRVGATKIIRLKRKDDSHFNIMCGVKVKEYFALTDINML